ncbi:MAG: DEAD/DEAH box helicase [Fibrobacteres bacterium]|nr:DEAD/DEAH box helicase [Fibrobacterota bacterium]
MDALSLFHPLVRAWFAETYGSPTDIQARSWPLIAEGKHVLLTAPTGSGKTLTAFLWALDRFAAGAWDPGATRILYVSPLKALNNDIGRNLLAPLEALRQSFEGAGLAFPEVRALVRSGDTPATERRRMLRKPPEILITTPESLNLMLLSEGSRETLRDVETVILDEVHAVAGSKRGVHLITAVDRLVPLAGEFQRIALTATIRPLEAIAAWVGGFSLGETGYVPREVSVAVSTAVKRYDLRVRYPIAKDDAPGAAGASGTEEASGTDGDEKDIWAAIAAEIKLSVASARSTLIFANNRRLSERLARLLNEGEEKPIAYAHHGSLSREIRALVEERMKQGLLPAIVATNSLELGIDIGALDQVILVQTPFSIASTLQKIGRAGHGVGQTSHALLFASHGKDLLDAAVAVRCALDGDLEETRPIEGPLDLLAQILVALAASGEWTAERMFAFLRTSWPYRDLPRRHFDSVLEMLTGRYEATRVRELRPRLFLDAVDGRVTAARGSALIVGLSGGTIPDRGLFALRHAQSRAKIGELDEEFVWERREGDTFHLGNQGWRITNITANEVEVVPAEREAQMAPFWRADERDRGFHFAERLGSFLERADAELEDPAFAERLKREHGFAAAEADLLLGYLRRQREATGSALPHRHHLLIEDAGESEGGEDPGQARQIILHAVWGGRLLRPWAYALAEAYEQRQGRPLEVIAADDCLLVRLWPDDVPADLLDLVQPDNLESLLRSRLEKTGFYAAHFRENAARALLLPRSTTRSRVPLWLNRLRSQNLLQAVSAFPEFPIALETWRECLKDEFDLPHLKAMLAEVHEGAIRVGEARTRAPSPFAGTLMWKRTNKWMYQGDRPVGGSGAAADLLKEIAFSAPLRPRIPRAIIGEFEAKSQRLAPGYAPQSAEELVEWAKERVLIPWEEWRALLAAMGAAGASGASGATGASGASVVLGANGATGLDADFRTHAGARLLGTRLPGAARAGVVAVETWPRLSAALGWDDGAGGAGLARGREAQLWFAALPAPGESEGKPWDGMLAADPEAQGPPSPEALGHLARLSQSVSAAPFAPLLAQWLRAFGPISLGLPRDLFGSAFTRVEEALGELAEGDRVILDVLSEDADGPEACDAGNVEALLRLMRRRARPAFVARPPQSLPHFLAAWQGVAEPARDIEGLQGVLEKMFGYPAPAAAWEADLLPARVDRYLPSRLDELLRESGLLWIGRGRERLAFAFPEDLDLFPAPDAEDPAGGDAALVLDLLRSAAPGRLDFPSLSARCPLSSERIVGALWELAWRGSITNDTFAAVRTGLETGFKASPLVRDTGPGSGRDARAGGPSRRQRFQRWKSTRPMAGAWLALPAPEPTPDALAAEELSQDRARQLLRRYGILFRELLAHELPALQWGSVFRSLRLLELSGEVLTGHFFAGIAGLQFLSPHALRLLEGELPGSIWWISAADPASPCGLGLQDLPYDTPPRLASTHLVFHGPELALVSRRLGRDLTVRVPPRHRYLGGYLACLRSLADREATPQKAMETELINGVSALDSLYLDDFLQAGFEKGFKTLSLRKRR